MYRDSLWSLRLNSEGLNVLPSALTH
uniref:Uncharacterized protein n=1 Tax=Anguilla anguilla TaxID=7936 RepID=A0A0E9RR32_ANGAN